MTKAFYSGFYPDGLGVGGTALGSASHRGIEDIIKNLDDISIQRLVEARAEMNLKLEDLETAVDVTIPARLLQAEQAIQNANTEFNRQLNLIDPEAGTVGARIIQNSSAIDGQASRIDAVEVIIGTDDDGGTLMGRIGHLETITTDGTLVTSTRFDQLVSSLSQYSKTFVQDTTPTENVEVGDLWIDSDDNNKMYRWSGSIWEDITPAGSTMKTFAQDEPPTSGMSANDLWFDTNNGNKMHRYDGTAWIPVDDQRILQIEGSITNLGTSIVDLENSKATVTEVNQIKAEINDARDGKTSLSAKLTEMTEAVVDGLAEKAELTVVSGIQVSLGEIESSNRFKTIMGRPGETPKDFTNALVGAPSTIADMNMTGVSIDTVGEEGKVLTVSALKHIYPKGWVPIGKDRVHKLTARFRVLTAGSSPVTNYLSFRLTNDAGLNGGSYTLGSDATVADGWVTIEVERTSAQLQAYNAASTHFRPGVYLGAKTGAFTVYSGAIVQVSWVKYEDVTTFKAMGAEITRLDTALVDGLAGKASAQSVTNLEAVIGDPQTGLVATNQKLSDAIVSIDGKASASELQVLRSVTNVRPNLLINGGMELGLEGITSSGAGTLKLGGDDTWGAYVWTNNPTAGNRHIEWPVFPVAGGYEYTISGDHMISGGGSCYFDIQFYNANWDLLLDGPNANALVGAHDFSNHPNRLQQTAITSLAPAGAVHAIARFVLSGVSASTICGARRVKVEMGPLPATIYTPEASMSETYAFAENTFAEFSQFQTATTDALAGKASATDFNSLRSEVTTARGSASSLANRLTTVESNINGKASATSVSNLEAELNNAGTGIKARLTVTESVAVTANNKAQSTYGVVADANGSIVGFQMSAGGNSSSFKIRADKFEIAPATSTGARTVYSNNSWKVYDAAGVLRVEMGVFV